MCSKGVCVIQENTLQVGESDPQWGTPEQGTAARQPALGLFREVPCDPQTDCQGQASLLPGANTISGPRGAERTPPRAQQVQSRHQGGG